MKKQSRLYDEQNDTEFWFAVYFATRDEKESFLRAVKLIDHGDKYIDGRVFAETLGVKL